MNKGILFTVIATSICDTIYHGPDIQQLPAVFFTAAMLSIVYIFTESINHTVFIHLLLNVIKFIPFGTYSFVNGFSIANFSHVIACTVLAVIGAVFFFGYFRPRFITRTYVPEFEIVSADE
jgi:hypothetical protein